MEQRISARRIRNVIDRMIAIYEGGMGWCRGSAFKDARRKPCTSEAAATSCCLTGCLILALASKKISCYDKNILHNATVQNLLLEMPGHDSIPAFNDTLCKRKSDALRFLKKVRNSL